MDDIARLRIQKAKVDGVVAERYTPKVEEAIVPETVETVTGEKNVPTEAIPENAKQLDQQMDNSQKAEVDDLKLSTEQQGEHIDDSREPLSDQQIDNLVSQMRDRAMEMPVVELTPENWTSEFGDDGIVDTPIGNVKMGENQYLKFAKMGRDAQLGMVKPTLTNPDLVIEDKSGGVDSERNSSYVYVKTFVDEGGKKHTYFTSVTVLKDGMEVSISSHIKNKNRIKSLLKEGNLLWNRFGFDSNISGEHQDYTTPAALSPNDNERGTISQSKLLSSNKDTEIPAENQVIGAENPKDESVSDRVDTETVPESVPVSMAGMEGESKQFVQFRYMDGSIHFGEVVGSEKGRVLIKEDGGRTYRVHPDRILVNYGSEAELRKAAGEAESGGDGLRFREVYHGSPHDFDAFDHSKMGTGEGSQSFGWGTYVTEVNGIAHSYADKLVAKEQMERINQLALSIDAKKEFIKSRRQDVKKNEDYSVYVRGIKKNAKSLEKDYEDAVHRNNAKDIDFYGGLLHIVEEQISLEYHRRLVDSFHEDINSAQVAVDSMSEEMSDLWKEIEGMTGKSNLYTVEIPDNDGENYLGWDRPISHEQKSRITDQLEREKGHDFADNIDGSYKSGEETYRILSRCLGSDKMVSEFLSRAGFFGMEYPAQFMSGGRVDGAKNYVIFNESDLTIKDHLRFREAEDSEAVNAGFNEELEAYEKGLMDTKKLFFLGKPSDVLRSVGLQDKEITMTQKVLRLHMEKHGFTVDDIKNLPNAIQRPMMVYEWDDKAKSLVIITEIPHGANRISVAVKLERKGKRLEVNELASVHGKSVGRLVSEMNDPRTDFEKDKLRRVDKEKTLDWLSAAMEAPLVSSEITNQEFISATNIIKNFNNPTLLEGEILSAIDTLSDELGVKVNKVSDRKDLPEGIKGQLRNARFSGLYDPKTGEVYVVMGELGSVAEAQATVLHEVLGHKGIRGLFGDRLPDFCARVLKSLPEKDRVELIKKYDGNEQMAAEEYVAGFAEGYSNPSAWEKVKAVVKEFLREVGIDLRLSDNDLKYLLWKAGNGLREGDGFVEVMNKTAKDKEMASRLLGGAGSAVSQAGERVRDQAMRFREAEDSEAVNARFNEELDKYKSGDMDKNDVFHVGMPLGVLSQFLPKLPIIMYQRVVNKGTNKKHTVDIDAIRDFPHYISNPIFIFQRDVRSMGILTEMLDKSGKNVCVAIEMNVSVRDGRNMIEVNDVTSFHGREVENIIKPILNNKTLKYVNKEKGPDWISSALHNFKQETSNQDLFTLTNIEKDFEEAKKIVSNFENRTVLANEIDTNIDRLSDELGVKVNKVSDRKDLPEGIKGQLRNARFSGLYDPKTGEVYVVTGELGSVAEAQATVLHEVLGHKGIRGLFGDRLPDFCARVLKSLPERDRFELIKKNDGNEQLAAEEYVAGFAEGYSNPSVWEKVKAVVREFLREMGIDLRLSDNDLKYLLWKAGNRLKEGDGFVDVVRKTAKDKEMQNMLLWKKGGKP